MALLRAAIKLDDIKVDDDEEKIGVNIVKKALEAPVRQIAYNAGFDGSIIIEKVLNEKDSNMGFDANDGNIKDLVKEGIIDPTKVTRSALQNAASIAALLLTTETLVTDIPEKEKNQPSMPGGGYPEM